MDDDATFAPAAASRASVGCISHCARAARRSVGLEDPREDASDGRERAESAWADTRVPPAKENAIRAAREAGKGIKAIARDVGVGVSVVQRVVANL